MVYTVSNLFNISLAKGIGNQLADIRLLFLLKLPQEFLLEVGLDDGEDGLNPVELRTVWHVVDWRDAKVLHGLGGMLGGMHFEVVQEEGERLAFVLAVEQLQEVDELLCCDGTFVG